MSIASMSARINSFCRGSCKCLAKGFAKFVAAYEMFDTLTTCFVKVCKNLSGVVSTGQARRNLIVPYNK